MKKPKEVAAAEAARDAKAQELAAAKADVQRLEREHRESYVAVRKAQETADEAFPQCRMVAVRRYDGKEEGGAPYVIVRRTPGGMLVVRPLGDASGGEQKFKWAPYAGVYREAKNQSFYSVWNELRDVPVAYMKQAAQEAEHG